MLNWTLGFVIKMGYDRARSGVRFMVKDVMRLDKAAEKVTKNLGKFGRGVGNIFAGAWASIDHTRKKIDRWAANVPDKLREAVDGMKDQLGPRFSSLASMVFHPLTAITALGSAAVVSGVKIEKSFARLQKVGGARVGDVTQHWKELNEIVADTKKSLSEVGSVFAIGADRLQLQGRELVRFSTIAIKTADLFGSSSESIAEGLTKLMRQYKLSIDESEVLVRQVLAVAQASQRSAGDVFDAVLQGLPLLNRIPEHMRKKVLPDLVQVLGTLPDAFLDDVGVATQAISGLLDLTGDDFSKFAALTGLAGQSFKDLVDAARAKDLPRMMELLVRAAHALPIDEVTRMNTVFTQMTGQSVDFVAALQRIDPAAFERMRKVMATAGLDVKMLSREFANTRTTADLFLGLLNQIGAKLGGAMVRNQDKFTNAMERLGDWLERTFDPDKIEKFFVRLGSVIEKVFALIEGAYSKLFGDGSHPAATGGMLALASKRLAKMLPWAGPLFDMLLGDGLGGTGTMLGAGALGGGLLRKLFGRGGGGAAAAAAGAAGAAGSALPPPRKNPWSAFSKGAGAAAAAAPASRLGRLSGLLGRGVGGALAVAPILGELIQQLMTPVDERAKQLDLPVQTPGYGWGQQGATSPDDPLWRQTVDSILHQRQQVNRMSEQPLAPGDYSTYEMMRTWVEATKQTMEDKASTASGSVERIGQQILDTLNQIRDRLGMPRLAADPLMPKGYVR